MFLQSKRKVVYWFTNGIRPHANVNKHFSFTVWPFLSYQYFTFPPFYLLSFSVCFFQLKITFYLPLLHSLNASLPCFICLSFLVRFLLSLLLLPRSLSPLLLPSFICVFLLPPSFPLCYYPPVFPSDPSTFLPPSCVLKLSFSTLAIYTSFLSSCSLEI